MLVLIYYGHLIWYSLTANIPLINQRKLIMPRGGKREGSGRKPLTDETKKLRILDPYIDGSIQTITQIRDNSSSDKLRLEAAIWILEQYMGKAKQKTDVTSEGERISIPISSWV